MRNSNFERLLHNPEIICKSGRIREMSRGYEAAETELCTQQMKRKHNDIKNKVLYREVKEL